jgi:hypothetical protein
MGKRAKSCKACAVVAYVFRAIKEKHQTRGQQSQANQIKVARS